MNLILLFPEDYQSPTTVRLTGRRLQHVRQVHRAAKGDELRVGRVGGKMGTGKILQLDAQVMDMEVRLDQAPPPPLPVTLLLALPRPKVLKRVLITAGSMGVKDIYLINSWRVEKSFWQSPLLSGEKLMETMILGLEQARDTILPRVHLRNRFKPFVEDELPLISSGTEALVAHPMASAPCSRPSDRSVTLAIGPEGGFIPYEVDRFLAQGFTAVNLGERILRVEAAVPALLARLMPT